jgi:hypothetical protein
MPAYNILVFLEDIQGRLMKLLKDFLSTITSMFPVISELLECFKTLNVTTYCMQITDRILLSMGSIQA